VIEETPPDDAGAEAQARFQYQIELATAACLQMLAGEPIEEVICEWHEDYIVTWAGYPRELTSVKHLEGDQARWTLNALVADGGLKHLYDRWVATGERCTVRLQTNSGLRRDGDAGPGHLAEACKSGDSDALDSWAETLRPHLEPEDDSPTASERVRRFVDVLTLEGDLPKKEDVRSVLIDKYGAAACEGAGLPLEAASEIFDCVAVLVATASRSNKRSVLAALLRSAEGSDELLEVIAAKLIDLERLRRHVMDWFMPRKYSRPIPEVGPSTASVLVQKLSRGGLPATTMTRARHLRVTWEEQRHRYEQIVGSSDQLDRVAADLYRLAQEAELDLDGYDEPYGRELHRQLQSRIATMSAEEKSPLLDEDLLWGGIYSLTHNCQIWWSPEFALEGEE
jgi:hypothetical protein